MAGRRAVRPGQVAVVGTTTIADPTIDRAVSQVRDAVKALQTKQSTVVTIAANDRGGSLASGVRVAISSAAVQLIAANTDRSMLLLANVGAGDAIIGDGAVTPTTGIPLAAGAMLRFDAPACALNAIYAVRAAATDTTIFVTEVA